MQTMKVIFLWLGTASAAKEVMFDQYEWSDNNCTGPSKRLSVIVDECIRPGGDSTYSLKWTCRDGRVEPRVCTASMTCEGFAEIPPEVPVVGLCVGFLTFTAHHACEGFADYPEFAVVGLCVGFLKLLSNPCETSASNMAAVTIAIFFNLMLSWLVV